MPSRSDDFNRADNASSLGTPSDGGGAWSALAGTWGVSSNQGYTASSAAAQCAVLEASAADGEVQVTVSGAGAVVFRATDASNYLVVFYGGGYFLFYRRDAGSDVSIATWTGGVLNGDTVKVTFAGAAVEGFVNGSSRGTSSSSFNQAATKHGIRTDSATGSRFENFSFTEAVVASFVADRTHLLTDSSGTVTVALTGTNTSWTGSPFRLTANPTGWSIASQNVTSGTAATVTLNRGTGTGTLTISDGSVTLNLTCAATATTRATGTWAATATWDAGEPPSAVSAARGVVGHAVTGASGALGDSPAEGTNVLTVNSGASLRVDTGATLTVRGDISNSGTLTVGQTGGGAALVFDAGAASSPSTTNYRYYGNGTAAAFVTRGTSGAHSTVSSDPDGGPAYFTGNNDGGTYDCEWCDFSDLGDSATNAISFNFNTNPGSATAGIKFWNCRFTDCGRVSSGLTVPSNVGWSFRLSTWEGTTHADESLRLSGNAPGVGVTRELGVLGSDAFGNGFDKGVLFTENAVTAVWGNVFDGSGGALAQTSEWPDGTFGANFVRFTALSGGGTIGWSMFGDVIDCYFLADAGTNNPHGVLSRDLGEQKTFQGCIYEYTRTFTDDSGDWFYGDGDWVIENCILLIATGGGTGPFADYASGAANMPQGTGRMRHCTLYTAFGYTGGLLIGDGNAVTDTWVQVENNIFWGKVANQASANVVTAVGGAQTTDDVVRPSGCVNNGLLNVKASGHYQGQYPGTQPGAGDLRLDATDPADVFVDPTCNLATWAVARGSASSDYLDRIADARAYLRADPTLLADLLGHVRTGFVVKHTPWRSAASDGTVLGAVQNALPNVPGAVRPVRQTRNKVLTRR